MNISFPASVECFCLSKLFKCQTKRVLRAAQARLNPGVRGNNQKLKVDAQTPVLCSAGQRQSRTRPQEITFTLRLSLLMAYSGTADVHTPRHLSDNQVSSLNTNKHDRRRLPSTEGRRRSLIFSSRAKST